jgi:hypothetical protein
VVALAGVGKDVGAQAIDEHVAESWTLTYRNSSVIRPPTLDDVPFTGRWLGFSPTVRRDK